MIAYVGLGAAAVIVLLGIALKVEALRLEALRAEYEAFKAQVKAVGEEQETKSRAQAESDKKRMEAADAENAAALATLAGTIKRLRDDHPRGGILPAAPAGSGRPDVAAFERAELERALGRYREAVRGLADEGTAATLNLDTAKRWAQGAR